MTAMIFKTPFAAAKEAKEKELYKEYKQLISVQGQSRTGVNKYLMDKYDIHSVSTVYAIIHRQEKLIFGE
ncbi:MAG: hypothetical protein MJY71_02615 [Bacteroidaceae bacterium]|nr:hypothetical protein [Bacteroidaceae bacterium]